MLRFIKSENSNVKNLIKRMSAPFAGGRFHGHHLAGVEIGSANGQGELALQPIDLAFTPPPAGDWQIVLMLR